MAALPRVVPLDGMVDPPVADEPLPLPHVAPMLAMRRSEVLPNGAVIDQLIAEDGTVYQFVRTLANALMGKVKLASVCEAGPDGAFFMPEKPVKVAIKQLYKQCVEKGVTMEGVRVAEDPLHEVRVLAHLSEPGHPNVMRLLHFLMDDKCYYIVLEFLDGGELFDQLAANGGRVPEEKARHYFWQALQGVRYMHAKDISHRDLSLENAMLTHEPVDETVKIIDFGLSVHMPPLPTLLRGIGRVGKQKYMASETYSGLSYDGRKVDGWCLGMMLVIMLSGIYPYQVPSAQHCKYFRAIANGQLLDLLKAWSVVNGVSEQALHLVNQLLQVHPSARVSLDEVEAHPWLAPERDAAGPPVAAFADEPMGR